MKRKLLLTSIFLMLGVGSAIALSRPATTPRTIPFSALSLTIEINATAFDSGVLFFSDTPESLEHLMIQDPNGQTVWQMTSSDPLELGLTEIFWETAEPDIQTALLAYPPGPYTVTGVAFNGTVVQGVTELSHSFPEAATILSPEPGALLNIENVVVSWELDPMASYYWLQIDVDDLGFSNVIRLPPGVSKFRLPAAILAKGSAVTVDVASTLPNGNATVKSVEFEILP